MNSRRAAIAFVALSSFLFALTLSVAPVLHELVHHDARHAGHSCALSIIHSGIETNDAPVDFVGAQPSLTFATIPALRPVWVPALFLGACVFEHAPPALS